MNQLSFRLKRKILRAAVAPLLGRRRSWRWLAQRAELHFHQNNQWRQTDEFHRHTAELFQHFGFSPGCFAGGTVVDLGAGSKLRTTYFLGARLIAVEPLAEEFLRTIPWCDLRRAEQVFARPAEERIPSLSGAADAVISINVLDHCYDLAPILENLATYLKPGGLGFLSFDSHEAADVLHPLPLAGGAVEAAIPETALVVEKLTVGLGPLGPMYGQGRALNYWLRKPTSASV